MKIVRVAGLAVFSAVMASGYSVSAATCAPAPQLGVKVHGFWHEQYKKLVCKWLPHCIRQMEAGGRGEELLNLVATGEVLAGKTPSAKFKGFPWSDAYPYNTIEAMCLALEIDPGDDAEFAKGQSFLRKKMEEWIPIILSAQEPCGYIHSYHDLRKQPHFKDASKHEFYVMGYFIEMGIAHYRMTGGKDRRLYDAAIRCADHLDSVFGPAPKRTWLNGHPGLEYALCRLADSVNASEGAGHGEKYARLARHFIRGQHAAGGGNSGWHAAYHQAERPAWEMKDATGHAVRATYFYAAMSALASRLGDSELGKASDRLFDSAINRKEYITGGVGASWKGEAFDVDFELANTGYCESCAACGMSFWAKEQHMRKSVSWPVDVQERLVYNNLLGSISEDGETFYYQNPLDSDKVRYPWHKCPCCVGNIPRTLFALKDEAYAVGGDGKTLYADHFLSMDGCVVSVAGTTVSLRQETDYPWGGTVGFTISPKSPAAFAFALRIPNRTESELYTAEPDLRGMFKLSVNGETVNAPVVEGYAVVRRTWKAGDKVELVLPMDVQRIRCDSRVAANRGKVALQRGPIVYNFEERDQHMLIDDVGVLPSAVYKPMRVEGLFGGYFALKGDDGFVAVPNYARLNHGESRSVVWMREGAPNMEHKLALDRAADEEKKLDSRTIDSVVIGDKESEKAHALSGRHTDSGSGMKDGYRQFRWRHAGNGGWFAYRLSVGDAPGPRALVVKYFTRESGRRQFDILVDGKVVKTDSLGDSGKFGFRFCEMPIPDELVKGKESVEVRFAAKPGNTAGGIFGLRMVRADAPSKAYLFSYFSNKRHGGRSGQAAGLHLAYSYDGLKWTALNDDKPFLVPQVGRDKLMRDPSICQGPDGTFHMVWTSGWHDRIIAYASSKDLVHWSEQRAIPVMEHEPTARNCWAPEVTYSAEEDLFYIYWATTIPDRHSPIPGDEKTEGGLNHRIYLTTTRDFKTFSKTRLWFNPDFSVIDAAIVRDKKNGDWIMVVKNENHTPAEKNIRVTRAKHLKDGFPTAVSAPITRSWVEGPSPLFVGDALYVYVDFYREGHYGAVRSLDRGKTWSEVPVSELSFPSGIRHGTAFAVDKAVVDALAR